MKIFILVAATVTVAAASNGYYHQEYNYKTSASSYKNNELQHKTDDQGYYSKHGDLEGRVRPKVKSNSEHSEYVNPHLGAGGNGYYDAGADVTSHGNLLANSYGGSVGGQVSSGYDSQYANNLESEGLASSNYISGASSGYSGSSHQFGSEASYESANLQSIASRLQNDLQQELQSVVRQSQLSDINILESELRNNLTARLNDILQERFGTQTIKGGLAYSLSGGRLQTRPNYDQRELDQLQRQIESTLLDNLRREYNYRSSHQSVSQQNYERYESTTTLKPYTYRPIYPNLNVIVPQDKYQGYGGTKDSRYSYNTNSHSVYSENSEFVQAPNVVSITTVATNVQNELNNRLNRILEDARNRYFTDTASYTTFNAAPILERLKEEVRQNLTYTLEEELRRHFGSQVQRNGYMFSNGQSNQYNYNVADLENLRRQVEDNLLNKLTKDFEAARQHWVSRQQHASQSQQTYYGHSQSNEYNYGAASNQIRGYTTPRYVVNTDYYQPTVAPYSTPRYEDDYSRPTAASIVPLIGSNIKGGHHYGSQMSSGSYESSSSVGQLQQQLQSQLSNQLQAALSQNRAHLSRYSSSTGQAAFDEAYNRLYEELQRNLTSQLQSFMAGSSAGYSSGYGFSDNQLAQLRNQLQSNLASQLQQGLQQSYSASASYSASSGSSASAGAGSYSSSNSGGGGYYRPVRDSDNIYQYGQLTAGGSYYGEDCQQGESLLRHQYHRMKRSYGYRSRPLGLSSNAGTGYNSRGTYGSSSYGQAQGDTELVQPSSSGYGQTGSSNGQEIDDTDETQQVVEPGFGQLQSSTYGSQVGVGQEVDNSEDTQQIINPGLDWNSRGPTHGSQVGQVEDNSDSDTQQVQVDHGFGAIGIGSQGSNQGVTTNLDQNSQRPLYSQTAQSSQRGFDGQLTQNSQQTSGYVRPVLYGQTSGGQYLTSANIDSNTQLLQNAQRPAYSSGSQVSYQRFPTQSTSYGRQLGQTEDGTQQISTQRDANTQLLQNIQRPLDLSGSQTTYQRFPSQSTSYGGQVGQIQNKFDVTHQSSNNTDTNTQPLHNGQGPVYPSGSQTAYPSQGTERQQGSNRDTNIQLLQNGQKPLYTGSQTSYQRFPSHGTSYGGQVEDNSEDTQQVLDSGFGSATTGGQESLAEDKREVSSSNLSTGSTNNVDVQRQNSGFNTRPNSGYGHGTTNDDLQQVQSPFETNYNAGEPLYQPYGVGGGGVQPTPPPRVIIPQQNSYRPNDYFQHHSQLGQEVDDTDTFPSLQQSTGVLNQDRTDQGSAGSLNNWAHQPSYSSVTRGNQQKPFFTTTTKNPLLLQYGTENQVPEDEKVEPLPSNALDTTASSTVTSNPVSPIPVFPFDGVGPSPTPEPGKPVAVLPDKPGAGAAGTPPPNVEIVRPFSTSNFNPANPSASSRPVEIPPLLIGVSKQIEAKLITQLEEIIRNKVPTTLQPVDLYKDTLRELRENITRECERLSYDSRYSYLHIQQKDVTLLEQYIESHLVKKLDEKFLSTADAVVGIPPSSTPQSPNVYHSNRDYVPKSTPKPAVSSNAFLQGEIGSQYEPNVYEGVRPNQVVSDSLVTPRVPSSTQQVFIDQQSGLPLPTLKPFRPSGYVPQESPSDTRGDRRLFSDAENEADLLIERIRNSLRTTRRPSGANQYQQPGYQVIQVKLENITPEQFAIISNVERDFSNIIDICVQNEFSSKSFDHASRYTLYQTSLNKLEQELRRNLSNCFEGTLSGDSNFAGLNKYSNQIYGKFEADKISDVKKYIEIRLIKKLRAQLKTVYNIETTENIDDVPVSTSRQPQPTSETRNLVKLEGLTPEQLKVIQHIEETINSNIEAAIRSHIASLNKQQVSEFYYQESLEALELDLKNNITEAVQRLCEPGFQQYPELVASKFDLRKLNDLEKYLQVRLVNKLRESIRYYSTTASSRTSYQSSHSYQHSHSHNSYQSSHSHDIDGGYGSSEVSHGGVVPSSDNAQTEIPNVSSTRSFVHGGYVKGGRQGGNSYAATGGNSYAATSSEKPLDSDASTEASEAAVNPNAESTTPSASWWKRFGNKIKEKITGKS